MELSEKCRAVLETGLTKDLCYNFRAVRKYVMCSAWAKIEEKKIPFRDAIRESWVDARKKCAEVSAVI